MLIEQLREALPRTPASERAVWVFERLLAVASGDAPPSGDEIAEQYAPAWLAEVPTDGTFFTELAPMLVATSAVRAEPSRPNETRVVLETGTGTFWRVRLTAEASSPHRINFVLFSRAIDPARSVDRIVNRDGRSVHVRDYGGDGPLLMLWHGSGCDATIWDGVAPHLASFRVIALDLPGHGASALSHLSVSEAISDAEAVLDDLNATQAAVVGHSLGGWIALHFAATTTRCRALVCLDGPTALAYEEMGLTPEHPGFVPDPPDVVADLDALRCPTLLTLSAGTNDSDAAWMVPFRQGLGDYVARSRGPVRFEWQSTGHMMILTHTNATAHLIATFVEPIAAT